MGKITKLANIVAKAARIDKIAEESFFSLLEKKYKEDKSLQKVIDDILKTTDLVYVGTDFSENKDIYNISQEYSSMVDNDTALASLIYYWFDLNGEMKIDIKMSDNMGEIFNKYKFLLDNIGNNIEKLYESIDSIKVYNAGMEISKQKVLNEIKSSGADFVAICKAFQNVGNRELKALKKTRMEKKAEEIEPGSIYEKAKAILPKEDIDHHETDLYLRVSPKSTELVNSMKYRNSGMITTFKDNIDGDMWYDLTFCYPFIERGIPSKEEDEIILRQKKSSKRVKLTKKAEDTEYTEEDKDVYNQTTKVMEECVSLLNTYIMQSKNMKFEDYVINEKQRLYRKQDLETLKEIKSKLETLFENN